MSELDIISSVWESHGDEAWRQDMSHWRGVGRWENDKKWQAIGARTVDLLDLAAVHLRAPSPAVFGSVLEWGPGGGVNLFAMRNRCERYYGVDISRKNLVEADRMIQAEGVTELFHPILLTGEPNQVLETVPAEIDVFISTAVFQHFPNKQYGADVISVAAKLCKPNALGLIQIRFDNGNKNYEPIKDVSEYAQRPITATSYHIDEFWNLLSNSGFRPLFISALDSKINYAYFAFARN